MWREMWGEMCESEGEGREVEPNPLQWRFAQVFGERVDDEDFDEVDIISSIEFDKTGNCLAAGDRSGRIVLFERVDAEDQDSRIDIGSHDHLERYYSECQYSRIDLERHDHPEIQLPEYQYKIEFQSHKPEFDCLKNTEVEEDIIKIRWCQPSNGALSLLSTNDKTIKYWKVQEKKVKRISVMNLDNKHKLGNASFAGSSGSTNFRSLLPNASGSPDRPHDYLSNGMSFPPGGFSSLRLPKMDNIGTALVSQCKRVYDNAHEFHINSISTNSDGETFISADNLRINLWNFEITNQSFNIVDMVPANLEALSEMITSAEFHPTQCNTLAYSNSNGLIRLIDMRQSALCDKNAQLFEETKVPYSNNDFTKILDVISDIKFAKDGRHLLSRDYMNLKLWDLNMNSGPVSTFKVHEYLRPKICNLYTNNLIFDKFDCCISGDGQRVATGSYCNVFRVFGCAPKSNKVTTLEASRSPTRRFMQSSRRSLSNPTNAAGGSHTTPHQSSNGLNYRYFSLKLLHLAWHPSENILACGSGGSMYMYHYA